MYPKGSTIRTPEMVDEIIARVSDGEPLAQVCRSEGMPKVRTFYDWVEADEDLAARFARAREAGFDVIAYDCLDLADTEPEIETTANGTKRDSAFVAWKKNQVETRLKLLAKWDPKRYGERQAVDLGGQPGNPVQTQQQVDIAALSPEQRESLAKIGRELATQGKP